MSPPFLPCLSSLLLLVIFHIPTLNGKEPAGFECNNNTYDGKIEANYTNNHTFHTNLKILLPSLSSNVSTTKPIFYNTSIGEGSDKVYGLILCRGDIPPDTCRNCTNFASADLLSQCQSRSSAIWYDLCQVQYSDTNFFDFSTAKWWFWVWSEINMTASEVEPFKTARGQLMHDLANKAAYDPRGRMFATGNLSYSSTNNVYGLMQCKPVISAEACHKCLEVARNKTPECCDSRIGGRVISEVCSLRFENSSFFEETTPPPPPPDNKSSRIIVILIPTIAIAIILSIIVVVLLRKKKVYLQMSKTETSTMGSPTETSIPVTNPICARSEMNAARLVTAGRDQPDGRAALSPFGFETIRVATNGFSDGNKLGKGAFGPVYKGKLLNGNKIAVKRLSIDSQQGGKQFMNEVELISKLRHKNLVRLYGWCVEGEEKLLIYEYIPNKSLDYFLFGTGPDRDKCPSLNWEHRFKIIGGIARGLVYLHEDSHLKIIHRDLKPSNILLDADMVPKISDFGLAKIFEADQTRGNGSRAGTFGYMAPEYERHGELSVKSDVFSFGVLLLEIISGQKNAYASHRGGDNLISYVWKAWNNKAVLEVIDSSISESFSKSEVVRCIHIGLLCVQEDANSRPVMSKVITMLTVFSLSIPPPSTPAFLR